MTKAPRLKVYDSNGHYQATCKDPEAAAAVVSIYGQGAFIKSSTALMASVLVTIPKTPGHHRSADLRVHSLIPHASTKTPLSRRNCIICIRIPVRVRVASRCLIPTIVNLRVPNIRRTLLPLGLNLSDHHGHIVRSGSTPLEYQLAPENRVAVQPHVGPERNPPNRFDHRLADDSGHNERNTDDDQASNSAHEGQPGLPGLLRIPPRRHP